MKSFRAKIVLTCLIAIPVQASAKSNKILPWDLEMRADVFMVTKLPEYLGLGLVCRKENVDTAAAARIIQNYSSLYAKSRDDIQKQVDDAARVAATYHGSECLTAADETRLKALNPDIKTMDDYLSEAAAKANAPKADAQKP